MWYITTTGFGPASGPSSGCSQNHQADGSVNLTAFSLIIDYWIDNGICSAFIMIIINLIIDKSRLLQNFNKILTKHTVFSIIL
jgi:hypothetical protein